MQSNSRRNLISFLRERFQRNYITIINASVTVLLIGTAIIVLLSRASFLQRKTAEESVVNLAGMTASEVQSTYANFFNIARTVSQIMRNYQIIDIDQRRNYFDDVMQGILNSNQALISIFTILKPNELDDMDAHYANTEYSDDTGQYITGFSREHGWVEKKSYPEYKKLLSHFDNSLSVSNDTIIGEPRYMTLGWGNRVKDTWVLDIQVPIMLQTYHTIGFVGVTINLEQLQTLVVSRNPYITGRTMVCSEDGALIAHYDPDLWGHNLSGAGIGDDLFPADIQSSAYQTALDAIDHQSPVIKAAGNTLIISYPLGAITPYYDINDLSEISIPRWAIISMVPLRTINAPIYALLRFSITFIIGAGILAAFVVFLTSSRITQRARFLQQDLERATTMQDSMKYGLFLMDQKYIIQGAYSKALEKILDVSNLEGKSFLEILASSVKSNEQSGLADYFEMIFKRSFDKDMLESINPIESLTYISVETGKIKNIRTNFALTEWGRGFSYILGTLEDITSEKALENQLLEAESQKEKEMQSLFQVIQLDPIVLGDFIDDAEYEFNQINAMLKNKKNYTQEVLIGMYQSIHAIKSNALILNLDNFAGKLQKLEGSIKALQEKGANSVTFDDFLSLILEENDVLKEKDQLKTAIMKIVSFKNLSGKYSIQQHYVLVETLTQVCKKAQDALNKDVRCVLEEIDDSALEYGPRRVIKEVLTQLVRNAVYHGIETPEERIAAGKDAQGVVRLSLRLMDKDIIINLSDDGRGLDFDLIKLKILEKKLLSEEEANDRSNLLKMIFRPGFTTQENADMHAGRGIGLSLVKDRIRKLNGKIKVNSVFGKGTTFTITIPLEQNQGASDASQDA